MLELIQALNTGGVLLCGLIVLSNPRGLNRRGNFWLGCFLVCLFFQLFTYLGRIVEFGINAQLSDGIALLCLFLLPVSFYLSIQHFIIPNRALQRKDAILFSLLVLFVIANVVFFFFHGQMLDFSDAVFQYKLGKVFSYFFIPAFMLKAIVLWILGFRDLKGYRSIVDDFSAAEDDSNLAWLNQVNIWYLVMLLLWIISVFVDAEPVYIVANLFYFIGSFYIVWNTLRQEEVFPGDAKEKRAIGELILENRKEQIQEEQEDSELLVIQSKLLKYIEEEKPYLKNDLNLIQLANQLNLSHHKLSHVLNGSLDTNFSAFINKYRAEEAKKILVHPDNLHYTMIKVAYESGYNSKTVFNTHFKKYAGMTPSQFRKRHLK